MAEPLTISGQGTPNPNAVKFTLNRVVAAQGTSHRDAATATGWAKELLSIAGVVQVFALNNFISVTKSSDADWNTLGPQVEAVLQRAFAS